MKNKKTKKGFTLVELLVVITILAVLATVSVIGYRSFTKKAQISNDMSLVTQLNLALQADEVDGGKANTPSEALEVVEEAGYIVPKLTPTTAKYNIIWNQSTNRFALLDEKGNKVAGEPASNAYENWTFASKYEGDLITKGYSVYLNSDFSGELPATVSAGIDVGKNTEISAINYTTKDEQKVLIRTNGGNLTVNAEKATVNHYGKLTNAKIIAVAPNSYHEFGEVEGNIEVESGHVQVENSGKVSVVMAKPTESSTVKVTVTNEETVGEIVTTDTTKTTLNVPESVKPTENLSEDKLNEMNNFAGGLGTEKSPYLIDSLNQWKYLASQSITKNGLSTSGKYFSVLTDLDFKDINEQVQLTYFLGYIDFNNHAIVNFEENVKQGKMDYSAYAFLFYELTGNTTIKNLVFTTSSSKADHGARLIGHINQNDSQNENGTDYTISLDNVTINGMGNYTDNNVGMFIYWAGKSNITLTNCKNYANIYNSSLFTGVFVGRVYNNSDIYGFSYCKEITYINCYNYGTVVNTAAGGSASILVSNASNMNKTNITAVDCYNYGTIIANKINLNASIINNGIVSTSKGIPLKVSNGKFLFNSISGAVKYNMIFSFASAASAGGTASVAFELKPEEIDNIDAMNWVDEEDVAKNEIISTVKYGTTVYTHNDNYVLVGKDVKLRNQPSVTVMAYDENNQVIGVYYTYSY